MILLEVWGFLSTLGFTLVSDALRFIVGYAQQVYAIGPALACKLLLPTALTAPSHTPSLDMVIHAPELLQENLVAHVQSQDASSVQSLATAVVPYEPFKTTFSLISAVFFKWFMLLVIVYFLVMIPKLVPQFHIHGPFTLYVYDYLFFHISAEEPLAKPIAASLFDIDATTRPIHIDNLSQQQSAMAEALDNELLRANEIMPLAEFIPTIGISHDCVSPLGGEVPQLIALFSTPPSESAEYDATNKELTGPRDSDTRDETYPIDPSIDSSTLQSFVTDLDDNYANEKETHKNDSSTESECLLLGVECKSHGKNTLAHPFRDRPGSCQVIQKGELLERGHGIACTQIRVSGLVEEPPSQFTGTSTQATMLIRDGFQPSHDSRSTSIQHAVSFSDGGSRDVHFWDLPVADTSIPPQARLLAASIYAPVSPLSLPANQSARPVPTLSSTPKKPTRSLNYAPESLATPDCTAQLSPGSRMTSKSWKLKDRNLSTSIHASNGPAKLPPVMIENTRPPVSHSLRHPRDIPKPWLAPSKWRGPWNPPCNRLTSVGAVDFPTTVCSLGVSQTRSVRPCMALTIPGHRLLGHDDDISSTLSPSARVIQRPQSMHRSAMDLQADATSCSKDTSITGPSVTRLHNWTRDRNTLSPRFQVAHDSIHIGTVTRPTPQVFDVGAVERLPTIIQDEVSNAYPGVST